MLSTQRPKVEKPPEVATDATLPERPGPEEAAALGITVEDLQRSLIVGRPPAPPKLILDRLAKEDKIPRWLAKGHVKWKGQRGYVSVSLDAKERAYVTETQLNGMYVGADNLLWWREDQWLAAIPRRLKEFTESQTRQRTMEQTKLAHSDERLRDDIERRGGKLTTHRVDSWEQEGE